MKIEVTGNIQIISSVLWTEISPQIHELIILTNKDYPNYNRFVDGEDYHSEHFVIRTGQIEAVSESDKFDDDVVIRLIPESEQDRFYLSSIPWVLQETNKICYTFIANQVMKTTTTLAFWQN